MCGGRGEVKEEAGDDCGWRNGSAGDGCKEHGYIVEKMPCPHSCEMLENLTDQ